MADNVTVVEAAPKQSNANKHYTEATRLLRAMHQEEFAGLLAKVYADNGEEYKPRLSAAERAARDAAERKAKAAAKVAAILAEYPDVLPVV